MTTLTLERVLDDKARHADSALKTWGELRAAADRRLAAERGAVTAVRFDGVDQPTLCGRSCA
jgi:hypothetical protein